jgi:hypothetical protein
VAGGGGDPSSLLSLHIGNSPLGSGYALHHLARRSLAVALPGCGGANQHSNENVRLTQLAALSRTVCREAESIGQTDALVTRRRAAIRRLAALMRAARDIPRVHALDTDLDTLASLHKQVKAEAADGTGAPDAIARLDRAFGLEQRIYRERTTLGLGACLGPQPRKPLAG